MDTTDDGGPSPGLAGFKRGFLDDGKPPDPAASLRELLACPKEPPPPPPPAPAAAAPPRREAYPVDPDWQHRSWWEQWTDEREDVFDREWFISEPEEEPPDVPEDFLALAFEDIDISKIPGVETVERDGEVYTVYEAELLDAFAKAKAAGTDAERREAELKAQQAAIAERQRAQTALKRKTEALSKPLQLAPERKERKRLSVEKPGASLEVQQEVLKAIADAQRNATRAIELAAANATANETAPPNRVGAVLQALADDYTAAEEAAEAAALAEAPAEAAPETNETKVAAQIESVSRRGGARRPAGARRTASRSSRPCGAPSPSSSSTRA